EGIKSINKEISKARDFSMKLRNSPSLIRELKKIFELKNIPFLIPETDMNTRWNSMYIMLEKLQQIHPITDIFVASNQTLKPNYPNEQEWKIIFDLLILLEPMYHATIMLSSSTLPTQGDLRMIFHSLIIHLNNNESPEINSQHAVASAMKVKFTSYWAHLNESSTISGLLDPCNKLSTFDIYEHEEAINKLHEIHKKYKPTEENKPLPPPTTAKSTR
ncbi:997_t:CDS:2, partial [Racocetra persica]